MRGRITSIAGYKNKMRFDFGLDAKTMAYQPSGWYTLEIKPGPYPEAPSGWRTLVLINGQVQDDATSTYSQLYANYEAQLALLDHGIDGNNVKQMQEAKEVLQKYLIER